MLIAAGIFDGCAGAIDVEHDLLGHAVHGEITRDLQLSGSCCFYALGFESQRGIFRRVEEVGTTKIVVPLLDSRVSTEAASIGTHQLSSWPGFTQDRIGPSR